MTKPIALYLRVSSDEQREKQSILTQREFAERYCATFELPVAEIFADDGISGTVPLAARPEGARLVTAAHAGAFETVYVYRLDRLGRDPLIVLEAVREMEKCGVQVRSMTEPFDTASPVGRLSLTMLAGFAGFEREGIIQRTTDGLARKARGTGWTGGIAPFGYRIVGRRETARLEPDEKPLPGLEWSEAAIVREMYHRVGEQGESCGAVAEWLNAEGIPTVYSRPERRGAKRDGPRLGYWGPSRVRNILVSTTYKGLHIYGKKTGSRIHESRPCPAIVSPELWERAQAALRRNRAFAGRNTRRPYLLRGLIKCGLCGLTYIGTYQSRADGSQITEYVCAGRQLLRGPYAAQGKRCPSRRIRGAEIERLVWQDVEAFLREPGAVLRRVSATLEAMQGSASEEEEHAERLQRQIDAKQAEQDAVVTLYRRGRIDGETLDRQLDAIAQETERLRANLRENEARESANASLREQARKTEVLLACVAGRLTARSEVDADHVLGARREAIEALVASITVHSDENDKRQKPRVDVRYWFDPPSASLR